MSPAFGVDFRLLDNHKALPKRSLGFPTMKTKETGSCFANI